MAGTKKMQEASKENCPAMPRRKSQYVTREKTHDELYLDLIASAGGPGQASPRQPLQEQELRENLEKCEKRSQKKLPMKKKKQNDPSLKSDHSLLEYYVGKLKEC